MHICTFYNEFNVQQYTKIVFVSEAFMELWKTVWDNIIISIGRKVFGKYSFSNEFRDKLCV